MSFLTEGGHVIFHRKSETFSFILYAPSTVWCICDLQTVYSHTKGVNVMSFISLRNVWNRITEWQSVLPPEQFNFSYMLRIRNNIFLLIGKKIGGKGKKRLCSDHGYTVTLLMFKLGSHTIWKLSSTAVTRFSSMYILRHEHFLLIKY